MNINVVGIVRTSRYALPLLRKSKCASIVNVCSVAATAGIPKRALYSATKGAVLSLTMAMANDYVAEGIRVNCVNPGTADTPWVQRLLAQAADPVAERKALEARQPLGQQVPDVLHPTDAFQELTAQSISDAATNLARDGKQVFRSLPRLLLASGHRCLLARQAQ